MEKTDLFWVTFYGRDGSKESPIVLRGDFILVLGHIVREGFTGVIDTRGSVATSRLELVLGLVRQVVNGQRIGELGTVLGVNVTQILTEDVQAVLVLLIVVVGDAMFALEVMEGLLHMLIDATDELLHRVEGGKVAGARSGESYALQAIIDLEHLVGNVVVLVAVIVEVVVVVVGAQQGVVAPHFVSHRDGHSAGRIVWRLLVAHPQRVHILLLTNDRLQPELVAGVAQKGFGSH